MALGASLGIDWCGCGGVSSYVCNDTLVQGEGSLVDNTILQINRTSELLLQT